MATFWGKRAALEVIEMGPVLKLLLHFRERFWPECRVDWATDPFCCGSYTFLRPGGVGAREHLRAPDTGALFWAGSATEWSPIAATVEAAYSSGLRAAEEARVYLAGSPRDSIPRRMGER